MRPRCLGLWSRTEGVAAVEFAILGTVLILIIGAILDFGHAWYIRQVITNASREGARYGVSFQVDNVAQRVPPSALSPSIHDYVINDYISNTSVSSLSPDVTVGGAGYSTGTKGADLTVTVMATKNWFLLGAFIPGFGTPTVLAATTVMKCE
jgi:Flp pilus assembly protein TadG